MINTDTVSILENCRVLLIDDNDDDLFLLEDLLEDIDPSIRISTCHTASQAVALLKEQSFDLCLLDYFLGGMSGIDLIRQLKGLKLELPIIMLTGQAGYDIDLKAMHAGAADFLSKEELKLSSLEKSMRYAICHFRTLAALRYSEKQLHETAFYDSLTKLPNRALFLNRLEHAFQAWQRKHKDLAILFIDLDGFKPINDSFGHDVGDEALKVIASRLQNSIRVSDTIARLGGDEFTILIEEMDSQKQVLQLAERLLEAIAEPIQFHSYPDAHLTASIGIAFSNQVMIQHEEMLRSADIAMYRVKKRGGNGIEVYDSYMYKQLSQQLHLEQALKKALSLNEFELLYQPIISLNSGDIYGFEALLRWRKHHQLLSPESFLQLAENTGQIVAISEWVLRKACLWAAKLQTKAKFFAMVNVSPKQFEAPGFIASVRNALALSGLKAEYLHLEITENLVMTDPDFTQRKLQDLKSLGVNIYLDDFGTGYSSLHHILQFPIDAIKLDRSFIQDLPNSKSEAIVAALLSLAERLKLEVVAEGIEELSQLEHLLHANCRLGQGFLFAKPLTDEQCSLLLGQSLLPQLELGVQA